MFPHVYGPWVVCVTWCVVVCVTWHVVVCVCYVVCGGLWMYVLLVRLLCVLRGVWGAVWICACNAFAVQRRSGVHA